MSIVDATGNCCREKNTEVFIYYELKVTANSMGCDQWSSQRSPVYTVSRCDRSGPEVYWKLTQERWF